jgi:hypothetical protein
MKKNFLVTVGRSTKEGNRKRILVKDGYKSPLISVTTLLQKEGLADIVWEPAAGYLNIAKPLLKRGYKIYTSDIFDWHDDIHKIRDFLEFKLPPKPLRGKFYDIVTNPPFSLARAFAEKALELLPNNGKLCLLLRLQFLEGIKRNSFFKKFPPKRIYVYSFRLPRMRRFDFKGKQSGSALCFAWFIFLKGYKGPTEIRWIARPKDKNND